MYESSASSTLVHAPPSCSIYSLLNMECTATRIEGAWIVESSTFRDERGSFREAFRADFLAEALGRVFVPVQSNVSTSARGALRGVHFAQVPPGQAKYVQVLSGRILDVVVDLRIGSPTFGEHEPIHLDSSAGRSVFISEGLGHAFVALDDNSVVSYHVNDVYKPEREHGVNPLDPQLGISWDFEADELLISAKDRSAPTLEQARAEGLLPRFEECNARYRALKPAP